VLLDKSEESQTPGVMITDANSAHFIWLPRLIWLRYQATGGPLGRLGQPVGKEQLTASGISQRFEHGSITINAGVARTEVELAGGREPTDRKTVARLRKCLSLAGS
jgi:hypothetical protein